jgi:AraC family transcriptional regulator
MPPTAPPPEPKITPFGVAEDGVMVLLRSDPAGVLDAPEFKSVLLAVHVGAAARITCRRAGQVHTGSAVHGDIDLIPARTASRWTMHDANDTALIVALPTALVDDVAMRQELDPRRIELRNRFQMRDPQLENIAWALRSEMQAGNPTGRLYTDSLGVSMAARLIAQHSSLAPAHAEASEQTGGLGGRRLRQTLAYIEDHLADASDLSLQKIATEAGISASHLKTAFRRSIGMPVHQYVLARRIERAKDLLMEGRQSILEIALATGFSHQGHLARHMRRAAGLSPKQMQRLFAEGAAAGRA